MRELNNKAFSNSCLGRLAKGLKRHSQKLRALSAAFMLMALSVCGVMAQTPTVEVGDTLWYEAWTGGETNATPSAYGFSGTTVYGGAILTYTNSSANTKLYDDNLAGGEAPELLLSKSNQTWTIENIPTGGAATLALSFLANKTNFELTSTTEGVVISGSGLSWTIIVNPSVANFDLTLKNTSTSNARIDNILLSVVSLSSSVAAPEFTPAAGTYNGEVEVTIACASEGAVIYYNLNSETDPTAESTLYAGAITISETTTIKAIAVDGENSSSVASATYTIVNMLDNPTFSPAPGVYYSAQNVEITAVDGAVVYYTVDGSDPTVESDIYSAPIEVLETTTIKAFATDGNASSEIVTARYTIKAMASLPFEWTSGYENEPDGVTKYSVGYYGTAPNSTALKFDGANDSICIKYVGVADSLRFSIGITNNYDVAQNMAGSFVVKAYNGDNVSLIKEFTSADPRGDYSFKVPEGTDLIVFKFVEKTSNVSLKQIYLTLPVVATPTFTPAAGNYTEVQNVTIACETEGAVIRYTLDESEPTEESSIYESAIEAPLNAVTTIKAKAFKDQYEASATATATYTVTELEIVATPTITPNGGEFEESQEVTLACETADANIYYTLNGDEPTTESTLYENAFTLSETATVKAIAVKEGMNNSAVAEATFTKVEPAVDVQYTRISSLDQLVEGDKVVIASRYDNDETHYFVAPNVYRNLSATNQKIISVPVNAEMFLDDAVITSAVDSIVWTLHIVEGGYMFINSANDTLGWASGTNFSYEQNQVWTIAEYTAEAGSLMANYAGYKMANAADANRCIAFRNNADKWCGVYAFASNKTNGEYNFALDFFADKGIHTPVVATPTFNPEAGNYTEAQNVTIACETEGAEIRYTLDGSEPTAESDIYSAAIEAPLNAVTTIKARAFKAEYTESAIATAVYSIYNWTAVETPTFSIEDGTYETAQSVSIACATEDAEIRYTLDGTDPTAESALYEAAIELSENGTYTIKARAFKNEMFDSEVATLNVTIALVTLATLPFDWTEAYGTNPDGVVTNGIAFYGSDPNYTAFKFDGNNDSIVIRYAGAADSIRFTVLPNNSTTAVFGDGTVFTVNQYANGEATLIQTVTEATAAGTYTFTMNHESNMVVFKFVNKASGTNVALKDIHIYEYVDPATMCYAPEFSHESGVYDETINVAITCQTEGATIRYTLDGTDPTTESAVYAEPIVINQNTTLKAKAWKQELRESSIATASYTFTTGCDNIAAFLAAGAASANPNEIFSIRGNVTFVYKGTNDTRYMYVKDETAGLLIYDSQHIISNEYQEGDVFSGLKGKYAPYNGLVEFVPSVNASAAIENTGAVEPIIATVETMDEYNAQLVKFESAVFGDAVNFTTSETTTVTVLHNGAELTIKNQFKDVVANIEAGATADVTGFVAFQNDSYKIFITDVSVVTSVDEISAELSIYPNPTNDILNINLNGMNAQRVELVNVNGQVVVNDAINGDNAVVSLASQPAGMYFVRIYTDSEVIVSKVTKF